MNLKTVEKGKVKWMFRYQELISQTRNKRIANRFDRECDPIITHVSTSFNVWNNITE